MTTSPGQQAADDLAAVREQWGDLLAAIAEPPRPAEWMPYERRGFLDQLAADDRADDDQALAEAVVGRLPLILREHPAPANLRALDAALDVEREVFDMCDTVAERVQRPVRSTAHSMWTADRDHPGRWHVPTVRDVGPASAASAGSRAYGLHWAAVWLEGRALSEVDGDLFAPTPAVLVDQVAEVARTARRRVEGALGRSARTLTLDDPCPFCRAGRVTVHNGGGNPREAVATCSTGPACPAPVDVERGRRAWRGADLVALWVAISASRQTLD
ncbi:hypothetical protein [Streptomyces sp. FR-008]|uniref:hypothetical protein n=1 Tax=Streptomyces sp. FR-008 TaxID=206662 RepID=UPI000720BBD7|nr:hypothetical protein [Streptomyces sp. FR-008]ALM38217.1 LigA protein [Streptomyces sp. FR-008]KAF0795860.1 hypothetical protein P405_00430 [Streptomyces sp. FR-008]